MGQVKERLIIKMEINKESIYDLENILIMALRYSLGRRTYVTVEINDFIKRYPSLITERVCTIMLRDIGRYLSDREIGLIKDDKCDYDSWIDLNNWLFTLAKDNGYNVIGYERR